LFFLFVSCGQELNTEKSGSVIPPGLSRGNNNDQGEDEGNGKKPPEEIEIPEEDVAEPEDETDDENNSNETDHTHQWGNWTETSAGIETKTCSLCGETKIQLTLNIGGTGPAGGIIFYASESGFTVYQTVADETGITCHYMEAAPTDEVEKDTGNLVIIANAQWGDYRNFVTGVTSFTVASTGQYIGYGKRSTLIIAAHMEGKGISGTAAQLCAGKTVMVGPAVFNDWFLPGLDELNELYKCKGTPGVPKSGSYWSSSQTGSDLAWFQSFTNGGQSYDRKSTPTLQIRAVRAF
jgi:hypothetical protein